MSDHDDKILRSVREVVNVLGGAGAVAELLGVGPTAIANWLALDVIPPKWFLALNDALAGRGLEADRALFREADRAERSANAS